MLHHRTSPCVSGVSGAQIETTSDAERSSWNRSIRQTSCTNDGASTASGSTAMTRISNPCARRATSIPCATKSHNPERAFTQFPGRMTNRHPIVPRPLTKPSVRCLAGVRAVKPTSDLPDEGPTKTFRTRYRITSLLTNSGNSKPSNAG